MPLSPPFIKNWSVASLFFIALLSSLQAQTDTCRLYDAFIRDGGICQGSSTLLYYGFSKENVTADSFDVFVDGVWQSTMEFDAFDQDRYNSTFLITPGIRQLTICMQGDSNCCTTTSFVAPTCGTPPNCAFNDIVATTRTCQEDGRFFIDITFQAPTPLSDSFRILDHEIDYGIFAYGQELYTIGPVENIPDKRYEFILQDGENETCLDFTVLPETNFCKPSFVWPGDTNSDNEVDNLDLANISLIFGSEGPARSDVSIEWGAKTAPDWGGQFPNGQDFKHADCNGDGIVDEADVLAIKENYFSSHGNRITKPATMEDQNGPILFVDFPQLSADQEGQSISSPIIFGNSDLPATAYGIAFTLEFDPALLRIGDIQFTDNWLGTTSDDLLIVNKNIGSSGAIEVAISKKDKMNTIGGGPIGNFIVIIDNIEGYQGGSTIEFKNVQVIDKEGTSLAVHTPPTEIIKETTITSIDNIIKEATAITIYPNPASNQLYLASTLAEKIEAIHIRSISGQLVESPIVSTELVIPINNLNAGIYLLEVQTKKGRYYKKFLKE